jgi:hypothetical protein
MHFVPIHNQIVQIQKLHGDFEPVQNRVGVFLFALLLQ